MNVETREYQICDLNLFRHEILSISLLKVIIAKCLFEDVYSLQG